MVLVCSLCTWNRSILRGTVTRATQRYHRKTRTTDWLSMSSWRFVTVINPAIWFPSCPFQVQILVLRPGDIIPTYQKRFQSTRKLAACFFDVDSTGFVTLHVPEHPGHIAGGGQSGIHPDKSLIIAPVKPLEAILHWLRDPQSLHPCHGIDRLQEVAGILFKGLSSQSSTLQQS